MTATPQVWFITGASSGFGLLMTRRVLESGGSVVATLRKPEVLAGLIAEYPKDRLLVLQVDVSKPADITAAFQATRQAFGHIDVVFNNAGYVVVGEVEGTPDEVARAVFEVDFWGAVHVSQAAVKFFREVNPRGVGGRLIQNSSIVGLVSPMSLGWYAAAKHALEATSESMARELDPAWNIKITIVEFGGFTTPVFSSIVEVPLNKAYADIPAGPATMHTTAISAVKGDPKKGAELLFRLAQLEDPPLRLPLGQDSLQFLTAHIASISGDMEKYKSWSDDVSLEAEA